MNDRTQGYMDHNGKPGSGITEVCLTAWGVKVAEETTGTRLAATGVWEMVRQGRYGVTIGSWWAYGPQGYPEVIFEVTDWSFRSSSRGVLVLAYRFQLALPDSAEPTVLRQPELLAKLGKLDVVSFWDHVTDGAIRPITKI